MRRLLVGLALATAALLATATLASADHGNGRDAGAGPPIDLVAGTGYQAGTLVHVNAQDEEGKPVRGHFFVQPATGPSIQGEVLCLVEEGNSATVAGNGKVKGSSTPVAVEIEIVDLEEPLKDLIHVEVGDEPVCDPDATPTAIERGNFIVHDATTQQVAESLQLQIDQFEAEAGPH